MSCENTNARLQIKYTTIAGQVPTIPSTNDHNDGTWNPTDIYIGEFFLNSQDDLLWVRTLDGILAVGGTGGSASFIGDFVSKANGGTYSGPVFAPTFSAINMIATTISATAIDATIFGSTGSTYYGDGSNLTGITTNWNGGTVSDPTQFDNTVDFNQDISVNNVYAGTLGYTHIHSDVTVDGGLSASYFIGDGSLITNLPLGPTANDYTTNAYLDGNIIRYDRTDLADAYSVDLTPILFTQSVASFDWNSSTNDATITINDGSFFTINLGIFNNISTAIINATDVYASNFYGTFNGTFSNDIYTTSASLVGTTAVFDRTDGITYSLDLSTFSGAGTVGATGATGPQGYRAVMNLSYTGSSLTLGLGTITLPIGTPINNLGWQQGTRVRVFNDATHYMEGQITTIITNPQTVGINVNIDYVVGSGSFVAWYVGIAGDLGSGGSGGGGTQSLEQTLVIGNTIGTQSINFGGTAYIQADGTNIELKADGNISGDTYLNSLKVYDDTAFGPYGVEQISFSSVAGVDNTSSIELSPGQTYEAHTLNDIVTGTQQTTVIQRQTEKTVELLIDQSTGVDTEYRRELGVIGTTNGSSVKVTDNNTLEETEIKTDKSAITLSSSAAAGQILATIGITASEITYSIIDTDYYDPYYSAIGTIGTQFTTFGNEYISPNPGFPPYHRRGSVNTKSGPASGNETWAELRSGDINDSSYAYIRATDMGGSYPANVFLVGGVGSFYSQIEQKSSKVLLSADDTGFTGIEYDQDWSANFVNRSLVDKGYVDGAISGGATGLGGVLVVGNTTDNNDIILSNSTFAGTSDNIKAFGNTMADAKFSFEDYGGGAWVPTIRTQNGNSTNYITVGDSETFIHNSQVDSFVDRYGQIQVGPTQITTSMNDLANGQGTAFVMTSTSIVVGNQATVPNVFPGIEYDIDYSANFTSRSLVDKGYVDNTIAGGVGGTASATMFNSVIAPAPYGGALPWYKLNVPALTFQTVGFILSQNVISYSQVNLVRGEVINEVAIFCSTLLAAATASIALYSIGLDANGRYYPDTLLTTFGEVSLATTGRKTITGLAYSIPPSPHGIYYTAILRTGPAGSPTITGPVNTDSLVYHASLNATTMDRAMTARPPVAFTSFPTTITSASFSAYSSSTLLPYIGFR
jgi:hypothetical protein